ncbi:hypothetical protein DPMN_095444 [Dreissena polymorpha]|uniref:Uncharacterized protein n=1 Tax=Dreissena polymorpha TaxID=45954 RepID=A0A9D4L6H7_DREPO|nr:hypothetical protein DPMN_095441 [Dreissena polymorpha]KAH3852923.1 hypothetical protein DPMN_095444 [Dreissena polymorpha]
MSHCVGMDINTCSQCLLRYGSLCGCGHQHMQPVPAYIRLTLWLWTSTHAASACLGMAHFVGVDINTCSQYLLRYGSLCGCGHQHMQPVPA